MEQNYKIQYSVFQFAFNKHYKSVQTRILKKYFKQIYYYEINKSD